MNVTEEGFRLTGTAGTCVATSAVKPINNVATRVAENNQIMYSIVAVGIFLIAHVP